MVKDKHDLAQLKKNGKTVEDYMSCLEGKSGDEIKTNCELYEPKEDVIAALAEKAKGYTFVVFSAVWCKDCKTNVAAFAKILEHQPDIEVIFFSGIKTAPLDPDIRWRVPPSPPEVDDFDLRKIPTFYILNSEGVQVGEMIENPEHKETLEEELLYILENLQ